MTSIRKRQWLFAVAGASLLLPFILDARTEGRRQRDNWSNLKSDRDVYQAACAACHGADGTGASPSQLGFDVPLPDFTDCGFSSREPAADWLAVAHDGGPTRGFDPMMPAFGDALSTQQLKKAVAHVKGFCAETRWPQGELNLPRCLATAKAYPEDELVFEMGSTVNTPVTIYANLVVAKRIAARHQIEAVLPFGVKQVETDDGEYLYRWGEGIGDMALGWKSVVWHSGRAGTIGSLAGEVILPTGDEADELGKGIFAFEPYLAIGQIIPYLGFLQLQVGGELSTDPDIADHEIFWRAAYGREFSQGSFGRVWAPIVEVLGTAELAEETAIAWAIVPELFLTLNQRQHIMFSAGAKIPVTEFEAGRIEAMVFLLWDWFDGGFLEGW
jgi:hypothetical protein